METWDELREGRELLRDDDLLVLDKPAGWSVMGERHDTDVVRLAGDVGETLWPAHRIDKVTSGIVLFARRLEVHGDLTRQFAERTVAKTYLAVATGTGLPEHGTIGLPLSVGRKNRVRIAAPREAITCVDGTWTVPDDAVLPVDHYPSTTTFERLRVGGDRTLLAVTPTTGRRHQIRVHLAWIGTPSSATRCSRRTRRRARACTPGDWASPAPTARATTSRPRRARTSAGCVHVSSSGCHSTGNRSRRPPR